MTIDALLPDDWPAVLRIYQEGLDTGTFEELIPTWEEWDTGHLVWPRLVAREDGEVLGWAALAPYSRRACYRGVAEDSIYIARSARGRAVGRALLERLCAEADGAHIWTIQASILSGNDASVALHTGCGFRVVGVRERLARKRGEWRDVILMERRSTQV
ncbi:MAG TPA: GNAT family N-acetyltransferase [Gaiellaceae bacterium]|nr:GNAT family N-acetyltransferase [Gaiellaceae bacterium]